MAKHFAVHSGSENLRHEFDARVSPKGLWETYLPAFEEAVTEADVEMVMGAYNRVNGEVCCGSKELLIDILREKWGFTGHVVSDCGALMDFHMRHKITESVEETCKKALENGCDMNCGWSFRSLPSAYEKGYVTDEMLRKAAVNIFTTRFKLGLFDENCEYNKISYLENDTPAHRALARKAAAESMVLLKNDGILPLQKENLKTIGVIEPSADSRFVLFGNYNGTASKYVTYLAGIQEAAEPDIRVLYSEGSDLVKEKEDFLCAPGRFLAEAQAQAVLYTWYSGEEGGNAAADVLFGKVNPSGRLPVTIYRADNTLPDFTDYSMKGRTYRYMTEEPLYPFGYGLSYTRYVYSQAQAGMKEDGLCGQVTVKNAGAVDGTEAVLVYIRYEGEAFEKPVRSLKYFTRVSLGAGEEKAVSFVIPKKDLVSVLEDGNREVLAGKYTLMVGTEQVEVEVL